VPSTSRSCWRSADTTTPTIYWRCVGSSDVEDPMTKTSLLVSSWPLDGPTLPLTMASIPLLLNVSSWRVSVLIQTERRIDRQCPLSDHQIIRCYCLRCSSFAIQPVHLETGPSDHLMVSSSFCLLRSIPSAPTLAPMVPLVHSTVPFFFFSFASSTWIFTST
jgi:hypothetical protein